MDSSRKQRLRQLQSLFEPGFRRMLVVSFLLHLLLPAIYNVSFFGKERVKPPVYRVNLVNKPVKNPQAGRPEATVQKPKSKPKAKPKAKPKPIPPKPKPKPKPVKPKPVPAKPKSKPEPVKPKPVPKPTPKPTAKPAVSKAQEDALQQRMDELRAKLDRQRAEQERRDRIEALKAAAAAESAQIESPIEDAPVGMLDGKGDEAGVSAPAFVQEYIQQQWSLSKYQVSGSPEAEVILVYNASGRLLKYRFYKKSGNAIFDESLTRAVNKSKQLNQPLPEQMEFHIVFNLKDMLDRL